jgi:UrcA family protein
MIRFLSTIAAAAALLCTGTAGAQTADDDGAYAVRIRVGDLNLDTPAGQATLKSRVRAAADQVCGVTPIAPLAQIDAVQECRRQLTRAANARIELARADTRAAGFAGTR